MKEDGPVTRIMESGANTTSRKGITTLCISRHTRAVRTRPRFRMSSTPAAMESSLITQTIMIQPWACCYYVDLPCTVTDHWHCAYAGGSFHAVRIA